MQIFQGVEKFQTFEKGLALALGNFDGLHIAHRKIIERTKLKAETGGLKSAVFLLDPHPVRVLSPQKKFLLLTSIEERAELLEKMGIDYMFVEPFTPEVADLSPYKFVRDYLVERLNVKEIVVGFDYTFGRKGSGTTLNLLKWGEYFNFNVEIIPPVMVDNEIVSSSLIRRLIINGDVKEAAKYLGGPFKRRGKVVHGDGRGQTLGFPTANLAINTELLLPKNGVYLSLVTWNDKKNFALTNVGHKPTFGFTEKVTVENFLLDFCEDIYSKELTVNFLCRIRDELFFKDALELKKQIEADIKIAANLISEYLCLLEK